jgi:hypothetical protein
MDGENVDPVRPSLAGSLDTLSRSKSYWKELFARAQSTTTIPESCFNLKALLLNNIPSIPQSQDVLERFKYDMMLIEGYAKWDISPESLIDKQDCDLPSTKQTPTLDISIAKLLPGKLNLTDDPALRFTSEDRGDYIGLFVLGWLYILSVRLIELRGKDLDDRVSYTGTAAESYVHGKRSGTGSAGEAVPLNIGARDHSELRWWTAILANGEGWQAILTRNGTAYRPIWEFHLQDASFSVSQNADFPSSACQCHCPSSEEALKYLFNFARLNGVLDQLIIGLASALILPSCNRWSSGTRHLLVPKEPKNNYSSDNTADISHDQLPSFSESPHLMTLSALSTNIGSDLANSFWEKDIPCNLVSEWLNPVFDEIIPSLLEKKDYKTIILAMAERRPTLAPLWLGASVMGFLPRVLIESRSLSRAWPETIIWTASSQCFMDPQNFGTVSVQRGPDGKYMIPREDEFRLLYLLDLEGEAFKFPPVVSYPPFGLTSVESCSIMVRKHYSCGHRFRYLCWQWKCVQNQILCDTGISHGGHRVITQPLALAVVTSSPIPDIISRGPEFDESLSENATSNVFVWPCHTEGTKPEDRALWKHEWLSWFLEPED